MGRNFFHVYLFLLNVFTLSAQDGAPLLTNYKESMEIENQSWAICQDINQVMLFANRKGILTFDGKDWFSVRLPTIPFSMQTNPSDGKIYIGGDNSYGLLERDLAGSYTYVSLSGDTPDIGIITKIIFNDSVVWFYGEQSVTRYNLDNGKLELRIHSKDDNTFTGMLVTPKNTFINIMNKGLYRLESDTLSQVVTGYLTKKVEILFSLPYNNKMVLVGLSNGELLLFDGIKYYDYQIKDDGYLKENALSDGIAVGDSLYAFTTLDGGVLVIDKLSGKIRFTINNQNDLPDDEIFAVGLDRSGGLWISHQYGLTRADLNLPVGNFSIYPGLTGNLTTSLWHNNELFVATSEGIFYLSEVKNYSKFQILIKKETVTNISKPINRILKPVINTSNRGIQPEKQQEAKRNRKNIFTRIFGRKISKNKSISTAASNTDSTETATYTGTDTATINPPISTGIPFTRKTVKRLKSINYVFKKVEGFNEKCRQLVSSKNGILAATNRGLFVINDHKANLIAKDHYINLISWQPVDDKYFVAAGDGYFSISYQNGKWLFESFDPGFRDPVYSVIRTNKNTLWLGVDNTALRADLSEGTGAIRYTPVSIKNDFPQRYLLDLINDSVFLYTESGIYYYDNSTEEFILARHENNLSVSKMKYSYPLSNMPWIRYGDDWIYIKTVDEVPEKELSIFKIFNDVISINAEKENLWVVDGENRLFRIDLNKPSKINPEIIVFIKSISDGTGTIFNSSNIIFKRGDNNISFNIVAPGYLKQNSTKYQYTINKLMQDWSPWSVSTNYNFLISDPGEYTLRVRAKDLWGNIGEPESVKFTIRAPFTKTTIFYLLSGFVLILFLFLIFRFREVQFQKKNEILEEKVKERTAEIEAQKEEITSSIEYASRIQRAMLPISDLFRNFFYEHFIIFKPRDIVSGDFYWIGEDEKHIFFTVADCTGHGVPGAFMSALGISSLNEIITNNIDLQANTVLNLLREKIITSLHQTGKEGEATDGLNLAFCALNKDRKTLQYSGAFDPLFLFQGGEFKEYKANRMPIGIYYGEKNKFTNYEIGVKRGDTLYIFSDGIVDQIGGPHGSKYRKSNLIKLLSEIYYRPMAEQRSIIENEINRWRGSDNQLDDITIIGLRI